MCVLYYKFILYITRGASNKAVKKKNIYIYIYIVHEIEPQANVDFSRTSIFWHVMLTDQLFIHLHSTLLAESIKKWVEGMAVREELSPLSGLICEIVNW